MARKLSLPDLRAQLVNAQVRECSNDWLERMDGREQVRLLKARIQRRERDEARRDLGLVRCRDGTWE